MNAQEKAAWALHRFLALRGIPYAIIGGMAVQRWGRPRFTQDVDFTILLVPGEERPILEEIAAAFPARTQNPVEFALRHRMLLLRVPNAADVDLSLGLPGYEDEVIVRAVEYNLGRGRNVRLCSAEGSTAAALLAREVMSYWFQAE